LKEGIIPRVYIVSEPPFYHDNTLHLYVIPVECLNGRKYFNYMHPEELIKMNHNNNLPLHVGHYIYKRNDKEYIINVSMITDWMDDLGACSPEAKQCLAEALGEDEPHYLVVGKVIHGDARELNEGGVMGKYHDVVALDVPASKFNEQLIRISDDVARILYDQNPR
jgi:hypothetical protein